MTMLPNDTPIRPSTNRKTNGRPTASSTFAPRNVVTAFGPRMPASVRPSLIDSEPSAFGRKPASRASRRSHAGRRCWRRLCHHEVPSVVDLISARRAATGSGPDVRCDMTLKIRSATLAKTSTTAKRIRSMGASDLDLDDATDPQEAHQLEEHADDEHGLARGIAEERDHVVRCDEPDDHAERDGQHRQHEAGQASVGGTGLDVA